MTPRRRIKKGLEPNLYESKGYFRYRHPITKKEKSMGRDKKKANAAARQLNMMFLGDEEKGLINRVTGSDIMTLGVLIDRYRKEYLPTKDIKAGTKSAEKGRLNRIDADKGSTLVADWTVKLCADYLDSNFEKSPYVKYRASLISIFDFAKRKGLLEGENPARGTESKAKQAAKKSRQRMTIEQYKALHGAAPEWLQNAMDIALITLQGLNEVVSMKFEHIDKEANTIKVIRKKTDKNEWAFLELEISVELEQVIARCRQSGIVSPFLIHHRPKRKNPDETKEHWTQILPNYLGAKLREHRDKLECFTCLDKEQRPTFHEIRSLGSHLYSKMGFDNAGYVQPLMAHADEEMTKRYQSGHEIKWNRVKAELQISDVLKIEMGK